MILKFLKKLSQVILINSCSTFETPLDEECVQNYIFLRISKLCMRQSGHQ